MARRPRGQRASPGHQRPPDREGVGASEVVTPASAPAGCVTMLDYLCQRFEAVARDEWRRRFERGLISDEHGEALTANAAFVGGTRVFYFREQADEPVIPFTEQVLYQDEHLVVADKPHFLPVVPGGRYVQQTLLARLKRRLGIATLAPIHRIDRDTAGLVLFSVRPDERDAYQRLFRERAVVKQYEAIAAYRADVEMPLVRRSRIEPGEAFMQMREVAGEVNAETRIELTEVLAGGEFARYALYPTTGQKHQLRVHMAGLGLPIVGDRIYPDLRGRMVAEDYASPLKLLAKCVAFADPVTAENRAFASGLRLLW